MTSPSLRIRAGISRWGTPGTSLEPVEPGRLERRQVRGLTTPVGGTEEEARWISEDGAPDGVA